jgi:DNA-binding CsgD family transcriptional regulator
MALASRKHPTPPRPDPLWIVYDSGLASRFHKLAVLLCAGLDDHEIAASMGVSRETVWNYIKQMNKAVGARTRAHLASLYMVYCLRRHAGMIPMLDEVDSEP